MTYKFKNFEIELFKYKDIIYGSFISFNVKNVRGKGTIYQNSTNSYIRKLSSAHVPELAGSTVFVPGIYDMNDDITIFQRFDSEELTNNCYDELIKILKGFDNCLPINH